MTPGAGSSTPGRGDTPVALVNLQMEYFVRMKGVIYTSLEDLVGVLKEQVAAFTTASAAPRHSTRR